MRVNNSNLGQVMTYLRMNKGLTKAELSRRSGVSVFAIINIEKGRTPPNLTTLWLLLDVLKADMEITY